MINLSIDDLAKAISSILYKLFGQKNSWRFSRYFYMLSRSDSYNNPLINGERCVQDQLINFLSKKNNSSIIFDIGANIGSWSHYIISNRRNSSYLSRLKIFLFEPTPETNEVLCSNFKGNGICDVIIEKMAVSSSDGERLLFTTGKLGTNSLHEDALNPNKDRVGIRAISLDKYCQSKNIKSAIDFIKCDTEGHDFHVILGAKELFKSEKIMTFQFEYNHRWIYSRHYLKDVFDFFQNSPYCIGKITLHEIQFLQSWHPELERYFEGNYIICHQSRVSSFKNSFGLIGPNQTYVVK